LGGFCFRASDPKTLARWYSVSLGVDLTPPDHEHADGLQERGPTVLEPLAQASAYFGDTGRHFMLTFRVANLEAMMAQLERLGVEVERDPEVYPVALWQPSGNELDLPRA
jgi:hypothetical protein